MSKRQTTYIPGKPFWVNVRQEHIDAGSRYACTKCPVALALSDRLPDSDPRVGTKDFDSAFGVCIPLPEVAREFIAAFDRVAPVKPFKFKLVIPERREANG